MRIALAMLAVAAISFFAGYEIARNTVAAGPIREQLAAIQTDLATLKSRPSQAAAAPTPQRRRGPDPNKVYAVKAGASPAKGPKDARVTIVEFSDFQCPYCSKVGPTLEKVLDDYPNDVRVVYKHYPLSFHKQALPAALASEAAGRQGKFWEMHDLLFQNQRNLSYEAFKGYASQLGLDVAKFEEDYKSPELAKQIEADVALARSLGVTGTPGFFVNGRFLSGAQPYAAFKQKIDEELKKDS
jgi:protein-disulfide isomerase